VGRRGGEAEGAARRSSTRRGAVATRKTRRACGGTPTPPSSGSAWLPKWQFGQVIVGCQAT
jgi:hypothetical protein